STRTRGATIVVWSRRRPGATRNGQPSISVLPGQAGAGQPALQHVDPALQVAQHLAAGQLELVELPFGLAELALDAPPALLRGFAGRAEELGRRVTEERGVRAERREQLAGRGGQVPAELRQRGRRPAARLPARLLERGPQQGTVHRALDLL